MNLDASQKEKIAAWINEGLNPSEIQNRLSSELGLRLTYMEVRFLLDDLKLQPKDKEAPSPQVTLKPDGSAAPAPSLGSRPDEALPGEPVGGVTVAVDQVTRPGALVSGKVTFSDGNTADWYLDQMGRLGLVPKQQGYRPPQDDLIEFQTELQNQLAKLGF